MQKSTHWVLTFHGYGWSARILLFSESCAVNIGQFIHGISSKVDYSQCRGPLFEPCAMNTTRKLDSTVMLVNRIWKGQGFWSRIPATFFTRIPHPELLSSPSRILFSRGSGIRENFAYGIRNPSICNPEYSSRNPESHWRLESRIHLLLTNTGIRYLESGIHSIESRIQDCPSSLTWDLFSFPMSCNVTLWIRGQQDAPSLLTNMLIVISDVSRPGATGSRYQSIHKLTVTHP